MLGERIKKYREENRMTQRDIGMKSILEDIKAGEIHRVVLRQQCVFQLVFILMLQIGFFSVEQVGLLKILRFDIF